MEVNMNDKHIQGPVLNDWPNKLHLCLYCFRSFRSSQALGGHQNAHRKKQETDRERREYRANCRAAARVNVSSSSVVPKRPSSPSLLSMIPNNSSLFRSGYGYGSLPRAGYRAAVAAAAGLGFAYNQQDEHGFMHGDAMQITPPCPYCNNNFTDQKDQEAAPAEPVEYRFFPPEQNLEKDSPMVEYSFFPPEQNLERDSPMVEHRFLPRSQEQCLLGEKDSPMVEYRFFPPYEETGERDSSMVEYMFFPPYEENISGERGSSMVEYMFFPPADVEGEVEVRSRGRLDFI